MTQIRQHRLPLTALGVAVAVATLTGSWARAGGHQGNTSVRCESPVLGVSFRHPSNWTKADLGESLFVSNLTAPSENAAMPTLVSFMGAEWASSPEELRSRLVLADPSCSWHEITQDGVIGYVCERAKQGRRVFWRPDGSVLRMDYSAPQEKEMQGVIKTLHLGPGELPEAADASTVN